MKWITFYGRAVDSSKLSHQHLSNILWYHELVLKFDPPQLINMELNTRFGGIRLPYHPLHSFTIEVNELLRGGYITSAHESDVIVEGKWVGKLQYS